MGRQLTIVVTCTDRKSVPPCDALRARALGATSVEARVRDWTNRLELSTDRTRLNDLYQGEAWFQARRLVTVSRQAGYDPDVFVASAGLGLSSVNDHAPAYSATFSPRHLDSVVHTVADAQRWWKGLPHKDVPTGGRAIWVLSDNYARAAGMDLIERTAPDELLVFGGSGNIPAIKRVPADRQLRHALGGTVTSLNVRAAAKWMELTTGVGAFSQEARGLWDNWSDESRKLENYSRRPLSDDAVTMFIDMLRDCDPQITKTSALSKLRESGSACEQSRFSQLYSQATRS